MNLNFLNEKSKEEFIRLYGENADSDNIWQYAYDKATTDFDEIDDIIFDIIDETFKCKYNNFNLWLQGVMGFTRDGVKYYWITFNFEDRDFDYLPNDTTTTQYGVEVMNKHFKYKNNCEIRHTGYQMIQIHIKIKNGQFYKGD